MKIKNISVKPICIGDASLLPGDTAEVGDTFADAVGFYISMGLMQVSINSTETANISIKYARGGTSKKNTGASQKSTSTAKSSDSGKSSSRSSILCSGAKAIGLFK